MSTPWNHPCELISAADELFAGRVYIFRLSSESGDTLEEGHVDNDGPIFWSVGSYDHYMSGSISIEFVRRSPRFKNYLNDMIKVHITNKCPRRGDGQQ